MSLDWSFIGQTMLAVLRGVPVTLEVTAVSLLIAIPLGFLIAVVRDSGTHPVWNKVFAVYVSYTRGTPVIVQILIVYALLPDLIKAVIESLSLPWNVYAIPNIAYAMLLFGFWMPAFLSEVFRAGLHSVGRGQYEAAIANGLTKTRAYTRIIAPQVFEAMLPVLCTNVNNLIKMTSLSFAMSVQEVTAIAKVEAAVNLNYVEAYLCIAVIYLILCFAVEGLFKWLERRVERRVKQGGEAFA